MRFLNSLQLLIENFKNVYRLLLYKFVIGLIMAALACAFVLPELMEIWNSVQMQELLSDAKAMLTAFLSADEAVLSALQDELFGSEGSLRQVWNLLVSMTTELFFVVVGCVLVYLLKRFVDTLAHFATGSILNDKMATYAETPFATAYIANIGKASVYSLVYVPVVFVFDAVTLALCYLLVSILPIFIALFLSVTVVVLCQSLKLTFTGRWLPAMTTDGKKFLQACRYDDKQEKKQTIKIFTTYIVDVYLILIVNIIAATCTFGSALLLTIPASYVLLICQQYVNYYIMKGKKYFITYESIATNSDRGDKEHFFDYIEEEQTEEDINNNGGENQ